VITLSRRKSNVHAELAVLRVLAPGGQLSVIQLARQTDLGGWAVRTAIGYLDERGLLVPTYDRQCWRITPRGREALVHAQEVQRER